ncbi:MAG: hypothetical protein LLG02_11310 [Pelosinus sp.]|nr:hypothetical protein [Pelosinus sp.]
MENIIAKLEEWAYLKELPAAVAGFTLEMIMRENGALYEIFTYANTATYRKFSVVYDSATKDFLVRLTIGLTEYYDISFISTELTVLEAALKERMQPVLLTLAGLDHNNAVCSVFRQKKIIEWPYATNLPEELQGFQLFIRPMQPIKIINGSYVIIDYSDFPTESNLLIFYNIFRDEFFGEARIKRTPQMIACFDAQTLEELAEKLDQNMEGVLKDIRTQLGEM